MPKSICPPPSSGWWRGLLGIGCAAFVWGAALNASPVAQETAPRHASDFITRGWYAEDGLPHNAVNKVIRDPRGFLWLGTQLGLARFDGRQFINFRVPDDFTLGGYNIRAIALEDEHSLLILTGGNKLVRFRDGTFELHPANEKAAVPRMRDLAVDKDGAVWIGTETSTVLRWDEKGVQTFSTSDVVSAGTSYFSFAADEQGRMWVAAGDFLGWHDGEGLHAYTRNTGHAFVVAPARSGGVWVAAREHLAKIENGRWSIAYANKDWPADRYGVQDIFEATDGTLWIATRRDGVFRLMDGRLAQVPLHHERAMSITDDIDDNVWLGMNGGGLVRAKPRRHVLLNTAAGLPSDVSSSVCADGNDALWCANQSGGLARVKDGRVNVAIMAGRESIPYMTTVSADKQGRLWAGSVSGLYWTTIEGEKAQDGNGEKWPLRHYAGLGKVNVQSLFCASNGDLWVSWSNNHLGVLRDGKLREFTKADGFPGGRVSSIAERKNGEIWISIVRDKLLRFDNADGKFEQHPLFDGTRFNRIHSLFVDSDDNLWLGTIQGLLLWRGPESRLFTQTDGLPDDTINQVVEDNHKRLWVNSRRGIFYVSIKQLLTAVAAPGAKVPATLLGRDENLDGISGLLGSQPMSWKTRDGRVWFITYRGIIGFSPPDSGDSHKPLPVYIDGISANSRTLRAPASGGEVRIPPGASPVEIRFTALNFSTPERTQTRRMLEGYDAGWVDAGNERKVIYPQLPPGRYVFHVQAGDEDSGILTQSEASLVIIVAATWWQTWWVRALALLVFAAIVAWWARSISVRVLRRRLRRLQYEHALERERSRIARDLHDDIGGRVTKISFVANKLQRKTDDPLQKEQLGGIASLARHLMEELHRVIWTIDSKNDSWHDLAVYLTRYTQRHLADTGILCTVEGAETIPDLPVTPEVQHHLLAITKESLNNMLKHSGADCVTIKLAATAGVFRMDISDNGRGFDTTAQPDRDRNGLKNMRARMTEIDARIDIASRPGKGTRIAVELPLKCKPPIFV